MKKLKYIIVLVSILLVSCNKYNPKKEDFDNGVWKASDGATIFLNSDSSVTIKQINLANIFFEFNNNKPNYVDLTGKWKLTTDLNKHKVISINSNNKYFFDINIKGHGIFEIKSPFDLFVYIGDPDEMNRYEFKNVLNK